MEGSRRQTDSLSGTVPNVPSFITAAHELKAPLALIRQLSLHLEADDISPSDVQQTARQIMLTSERALRLTTDITKAARLEDSFFTLEPLNPLVLCREVADELRPLFKAQGRAITVKSPRSLLGLANHELLRRILLNFADNALHYSEIGQSVTITAASRSSGDCIRLGVRDFGPALPAHLRKNVGTQATPSASRPNSSGLGIYIARQFADAMHATIGTTSHKDGTTFYVDIGTSTQMRLL